LLDSCQNTATSATDVCVQLYGGSGATVQIYEDHGECSATVNGAMNAILNLDLVTAELCLQELNEFDPDNDTFSTSSCGLSGP
jgi:hypothetical protein